jgi:NADH-quinone oxidoreductase subunit J
MEIAPAAIDRERDPHQLRDPGEDAVVGCEMTAQLAVFFVLAALAVIGAVSLILQKHPIHSALSLIVVMIALAGLYLLLGAEFVAAVQIIVYGGAIMVLFVFVIMLLNAGVEEHTSISKMAGAPGLLLVVALAGFVAATIARSTENIQATSQTGELASTLGISNMLFKDFVYPFELTSFLILVAVLGATVLAQREKS